MKLSFPHIVIVTCLVSVVSAPVLAVTPDLSTRQHAVNEEIIHLPWKYELKTYPLAQSNSTFKLTRGYSLLLGEAARHYDHLSQGTQKDPHTEGLVFNHRTGVQLILNYYPEGYVSLEDWEDLDPDTLMQEISENARQINRQRAKNHKVPLRIGGWLQKPRLNLDNHSISWVFDITDGEEKTINAVSIKLGRRGYEKITWVSTYDNYLKSMDAMAFLVDQHQFKEGYRYEDYSIGDQLAEVGAASLVAVTAGGNPQKVGLAALYAGLVNIGKNLLVPVLIALGTLAAFFRRLFGNKKRRMPKDPQLPSDPLQA